jgi:hypothetical protein
MAALPTVEHRILYCDRRFHAAFPSVAVRADGVPLIAFRRARDHRWLRGSADRSSDAERAIVDHFDSRSQIVLLEGLPGDGVSMEPRGLPPDPQAADQDASLLILHDGRILLTGFCWYPVPTKEGEVLRALGLGLVGSPRGIGELYLFWGAYARWSDDSGLSWSPHRFLPGLPGHGDLVPGQRPLHGGGLRGRAVELADGTILQATYAHHPATGQYASHLFASADRGESWEYRGTIAFDPEGKVGFCESALTPLPDATLLAFHRTTGLDDCLATSRSRDGGRSWEPWRVHPDVGGHPHDACPLPDGRLLVCSGYRHRPYGVRARLWDPVEQDIADAAEIVLRDDAPSGDVGYPWAALLPDGRALVVCYISDDEGVRHIAGSLMRW